MLGQNVGLFYFAKQEEQTSLKIEKRTKAGLADNKNWKKTDNNLIMQLNLAEKVLQCCK